MIVPSPKSGGLFIDSLDPESTKNSWVISWTDAMPEVFMKMRGYDLTRYLPVVAGWDITGATD